MKYVVGMSDGMTWNAGGSAVIAARTLRAAKRKAQEWADAGDYPVSPASPPTVTLTLWTCVSGERGDNIDRWHHIVPATACSGQGSQDI